MTRRTTDENVIATMWPVMLTPFTADGKIDADGLDRLTDWYIEAGVAGLFTVCLSSEMYALSNTERLSLAKLVAKRASGAVPVVASATFEAEVSEQADFVKRMADTGVTAVVFIVNQLARQEQPDELLKSNVETLLEATGDITLGLYECPRPYHRLLPPKLLGWAASTGRFMFIKETSSQVDLIKQKIAAVQGTTLAFFNASEPTILASLRLGGDGFSGVAANYYPVLVDWLCKHFRDQPETAERLQQFITDTEPLMKHKYPTCAKQFMASSGIKINTFSRESHPPFNADEIAALEGLREDVRSWHEELGLPGKP